MIFTGDGCVIFFRQALGQLVGISSDAPPMG